jgi:radical SAM protein with 4Fe4S-binding SPASM domain
MDEFTLLPGSFDRWRRTVDTALEATKNYKQITIVALTTFNEANQDFFLELIDFLVKEIGVDDVSFHLVRSHSNYKPKLDLEKFREANAYYFQKYSRQNPVLAAYREGWRNRSADYYEMPSYRKRCASGKIRVVMAPNGDIYPCETLGYPNLSTMSDWKIGNIREFGYDLNSAVNSDQAKKLYSRICSTMCHCEHNIDQNLSALASKTFRRKILRNTIRRVRAKPEASQVQDL